VNVPRARPLPYRPGTRPPFTTLPYRPSTQGLNATPLRSTQGVPLSGVVPALGRGAQWLAHGLWGGTPAGLQIANEDALSNKVPRSDVYARGLADMRVSFRDLHPAQQAQMINVLRASNIAPDRLHSTQLQAILSRAMNPQTIRGY